MKTKSVHSIRFKWLKNKMYNCNWSIKDGRALYEFPYWLLEKVYSKSPMVKYHGRWTRGRLVYLYIPGIWTIDKVPIIVDVIIELYEPPRNATYMYYQELKQVFLNNKYKD